VVEGVGAAELEIVEVGVVEELDELVPELVWELDGAELIPPLGV
jgi:hypothetical protein